MIARVRCGAAAAIVAAAVAVVIVSGPAVAAPQAMAMAATPAPSGAPFRSTDSILRWINTYRLRPDPGSLPAIVRALSAMGAFKDAGSSGAYIGFIAGVLGANPARAEYLIIRMLRVMPDDHWVLVRAIAYSGLSNWRELLTFFEDRIPTRRVMIADYLDGKLPNLDQIVYPGGKPGMIDKIKIAFRIGGGGKKQTALDPSPELIDVLWGYYLATGAYKPVGQIVRLLPLANDHDSIDNLTTGSAAKFTLASNAVRDRKLLAMLKGAAKIEPKETAAILDDVIETAETVDTARMRKQSLAAIEELKQKGPNSRRELTGMAQIGQGALSMGCIVAAVAGQVALGVPCVIGGAAYSAGMQYMSR